MTNNGKQVRTLRQRGRKRALVTGGAGFIGSHLVEALVDDGYQVTVLDNLTTGAAANIADLDGARGFEVVVGDVADTDLLERLVPRHDVVFHLAAAVGVRLILADPIQSLRTNVLGTERLLHVAADSGAKVLLASTSEVYGKVARLPQHEDDDVLLGSTAYSRWSYAAGKMLDEFLGLAYARAGLPVVCFRLFNTVGPRQSGQYGMVVPRFVEAALRRNPLPVYGDGTQTRCFLHVHDAVRAIMRLSRAPAAVGKVFNIGSTAPVTILELAQRTLEATGYQGDPMSLISFVPYEYAYTDEGFEEIQARRPDISRITNLTRWKPRLGLDDILRDVVQATGEAIGEAPEGAVAAAAAS